jgi:hypothetical protein
MTPSENVEKYYKINKKLNITATHKQTATKLTKHDIQTKRNGINQLKYHAQLTQQRSVIDIRNQFESNTKLA